MSFEGVNERVAPSRKHVYLDETEQIPNSTEEGNVEDVLQKVTGKRFSITQLLKRKSKKDGSSKEDNSDDNDKEVYKDASNNEDNKDASSASNNEDNKDASNKDSKDATSSGEDPSNERDTKNKETLVDNTK